MNILNSVIIDGKTEIRFIEIIEETLIKNGFELSSDISIFEKKKGRIFGLVNAYANSQKSQLILDAFNDKLIVKKLLNFNEYIRIPINNYMSIEVGVFNPIWVDLTKCESLALV
jgi:hypothetical protein